MAPTDPVSASLGEKAFSVLFGKLITKVGVAAGKQLLGLSRSLALEFGPHLESTFNRCTKIKTILNPDAPVELLSIYVNLSFKCNGTIFDDYKAIEEIRNRRRVVICSHGGSGKTIFMKYLWTSFFEHPRGQIPVFIELRSLNDIGTDNLLAYIFHTIQGPGSKIGIEDFMVAVSEGLFVFLFDGFDEIIEEKRAAIERQILEICRNSPNSTVIVSGRPDEKFGAWQNFSVFQVQPLSKKSVVSLIEKLDFDPTTKKKFSRRVKDDLYDKHKSFLSTPLLSIMMLMTFRQFSDVPDKIHIFYEQAFDTLFARHDATKESFKRKMHTNLPIDIFKRYFSLFCLLTYYDGKHEFNETEMRDYLKKVSKAEDSNVDTEGFLKDLQESVCLMQRDGLSVTFTHRSFQEFFSAYYLARVSQKRTRIFAEKLARRSTDSMITMLYDMNPELLEDEYILPTLNELSKKIEPSMNFIAYLSAIETIGVVFLRKKNDFTVARFPDGQFGYFVRLLPRIYPSHLRKPAAAALYHDKDISVIEEKIQYLMETYRLKIPCALVFGDNRQIKNSDFSGNISISKEEWLEDLGLSEYSRKERDAIISISRQIRNRREKKDQTIDEIFGLDKR